MEDKKENITNTGEEENQIEYPIPPDEAPVSNPPQPEQKLPTENQPDIHSDQPESSLNKPEEEKPSIEEDKSAEKSIRPELDLQPESSETESRTIPPATPEDSKPEEEPKKQFSFSKEGSRGKISSFRNFINKYDLIIIAVLVVALLISWGNDKTNQLQNELSESQSEVEDLQKANSDLKKTNQEQANQITSLSDELDELKNGKDKMLNDVKLAMEKSEWQQAIDLADDLHEKYLDTEQDKEGQELKKQAQAKIKEAEDAEKKKKEEEERKKAEEEAKGYETGITFEQLARTPDDYVGKKVKFTGKVLQVVRGDIEDDVRLAVNDDYGTVIYCVIPHYIKKENILDDDQITIYGLSTGEYTYQSTLGASITLPCVLVDKYE